MKLTKLEQAMYEKAVEDMESLNLDDREAAHTQADTILETLLMDLGLNDLADAYEKASDHFWYA